MDHFLTLVALILPDRFQTVPRQHQSLWPSEEERSRACTLLIRARRGDERCKSPVSGMTDTGHNILGCSGPKGYKAHLGHYLELPQ